MSTSGLAQHLFDRAAADEQAAYRILPRDDIPAVRAAIRQLARERHIHIRTAVVDDVLAVVRKDAKIWNEPVSTMRTKLTPG